tara:strand:+ start:98 stop:286 length:189 start_codon:yes stop_codon:yes gene_type:complete
MNMNKLEEDMIWVIGYIAGLTEKLIDAVREGDIVYRSAIEIASRHDHMFGGDIEKAVMEGCQ